MMFQYFVKVVPTVYMKLDGEVSHGGSGARDPLGVKHLSPSNLGGEVPPSLPCADR